MNEVEHVSNNLVFTTHGKERRCQRRFSRGHIAACIAKGQPMMAGHLNKKRFKGLEVVYKVDQDGKYVVVSFYPLSAKTVKLDRMMEFWNMEVV